MHVRFKDGRQDCYPVWENVLLVKAVDPADAWQKGCERATLDEGDSDGSFTWRGRPAAWVFAGLRKTVQVSHYGADGSRLAHGDELTYSEFEVSDEAALRELVAGKAVQVKYVE